MACLLQKIFEIIYGSRNTSVIVFEHPKEKVTRGIEIPLGRLSNPKPIFSCQAARNTYNCQVRAK